MTQQKLPLATVVLLGPAMHAVSGVSTHLNQVFKSALATDFRLLHFRVGSEGRQRENAFEKLTRLIVSPVAFAAFCVRNRPDIVHLNTSMSPKSYWRDVAYLSVAKLLGRRVLYQVHGGALPEDMFRGNAPGRWLLRRVLRASDVVVVLAQIEQRAYSKFTPEVPLEVIANAIDAECLVQDRIDSKGLGPLRLVYVGRIAESKGMFEVVRALSLLRSEGRSMHLTVAGIGPDDAKLREVVSGLGLNDQVHFVGPVYGEAKDALWRRAHVFAFPTYHREGLPYALLEAMAAGAVPVTTAVGAIPDVMVDGVDGVLVEARNPVALADTLRRLDNDRELLARMAEAGRARVLESYTVSRLADDFRRVYLRLAGKD